MRKKRYEGFIWWREDSWTRFRHGFAECSYSTCETMNRLQQSACQSLEMRNLYPTICGPFCEKDLKFCKKIVSRFRRYHTALPTRSSSPIRGLDPDPSLFLSLLFLSDSRCWSPQPICRAPSSLPQTQTFGTKPKLFLHGRQVPRLLRYHNCLLSRTNCSRLLFMRSSVVPTYRW